MCSFFQNSYTNKYNDVNTVMGCYSWEILENSSLFYGNLQLLIIIFYLQATTLVQAL